MLFVLTPFFFSNFSRGVEKGEGGGEWGGNDKD